MTEEQPIIYIKAKPGIEVAATFPLLTPPHPKTDRAANFLARDAHATKRRPSSAIGKHLYRKTRGAYMLDGVMSLLHIKNIANVIVVPSHDSAIAQPSTLLQESPVIHHAASQLNPITEQQSVVNPIQVLQDEGSVMKDTNTWTQIGEGQPTHPDAVVEIHGSSES